MYVEDGKKMFKRQDTVPGGVIHVLGDVNFERMRFLVPLDPMPTYMPFSTLTKPYERSRMGPTPPFPVQ